MHTSLLAFELNRGTSVSEYITLGLLTWIDLLCFVFLCLLTSLETERVDSVDPSNSCIHEKFYWGNDFQVLGLKNLDQHTYIFNSAVLLI